jgi:hypothetical protein
MIYLEHYTNFVMNHINFRVYLTNLIFIEFLTKVH